MKFILIYILLFSSEIIAKEYYKKNIVDKAHETVSERVLRFSDGIDEFFADSKHEKIKNKSKMKLSFDTHFREGRGPYITPEIDFRLVLPRTERKLQLFIENEDSDNGSDTSQSPVAASSNSQEDNDLTAGLKYVVEKSGIQFSSGSGIIVSVPIVVFAKFSASKSIKFTEWILKIQEQVKWVNNNGITSNLDLDFDKRLTRKHILRMVNNTFWNDQDYIVRFENGPSLFHSINRKIAMAYHAHIITVNEPQFAVANYLLQVTYRQKLYGNWLYMNLSPFVNFPRTENFHRTPGFLVSFDAIFGHI